MHQAVRVFSNTDRSGPWPWASLVGACTLLAGSYFLLADLVRDRSPMPAGSRIDQAELAELPRADRSIAAKAEHRTVELTHEVCCDARAISVRMRFDAPGDSDYALLPVVSADNYWVSVNGVDVRVPGRLEPVASYHGNARILTRLPRGILRQQDNQIHFIAVRNAVPYFDIYPSYVAPFAQLEARLGSWLWMMNEFRLISVIVMGLIAIAGLSMLVSARNRSMAAWMSGLALMWCCYVGFYRWFDFQGSPAVRMGYFVLLANSLSLTWLGFVNAFAAGRNAIWNRLVALGVVLWGIATVASWALIAIEPSAGFDSSSGLTIAVGLVCYTLAIARVLWSLRRGGLKTLWESAIFLICLVFLFVDVIGELVWNQPWGHGTNATVVFFSALAVAMLIRNVRWHESLLSFNDELARRLDERNREIEAGAMALAEAHRERDVAEERQRILRDMHDGVGGRLAALSGILRQRGGTCASDEPKLLKDVETAVSDALQDLRLMIDSLDVIDDDLSLALGTLRPRLQSWLAQHDIELCWRCELNEVDGFGPRDVLDIYRIVQEACGNAVQHADARTVTVSAFDDVDGFVISIADDGGGIPAEQSAGRGLDSMQRRAERLGGVLDIVSSGHEGTTVSLRLTADVRNAVEREER